MQNVEIKDQSPHCSKHLLYTGYLLNFKLKNMSKLYYRIAHEETQQGLWYDSLEDLFNWFSKEDIERLENHGWFITVYEAEKVKQYKNHLVICQETSLVKERLSLACV